MMDLKFENLKLGETDQKEREKVSLLPQFFIIHHAMFDILQTFEVSKTSKVLTSLVNPKS